MINSFALTVGIEWVVTLCFVLAICKILVVEKMSWLACVVSHCLSAHASDSKHRGFLCSAKYEEFYNINFFQGGKINQTSGGIHQVCIGEKSGVKYLAGLISGDFCGLRGGLNLRIGKRTFCACNNLCRSLSSIVYLDS